jgi:hypothetical protein
MLQVTNTFTVEDTLGLTEIRWGLHTRNLIGVNGEFVWKA